VACSLAITASLGQITLLIDGDLRRPWLAGSKGKSIGAPVIGAVLDVLDPKVHRRPTQPYSGYYRGAGR
jgi:hypothetical protein